MISVYIHIPFCKNICSYCDFSKVYYDEKIASAYLDELKKEIISNYKGEDIYTLYIGGGTPSCLSLTNLDKLKDIINIFKGKIEELTFECNIEDINELLMNKLKELKVNRLSIGMESTHDKYLKYLNRNYNKNLIDKNLNIALKYFDNINVDLMYAIKGETLKELEEDILYLKDKVNHISTYSLIIEPHTKLYNDNTEYISEDLDRSMYDLICNKLDNYNHYEVSNFAKEGYESKHNLVYWNNLNYYGFGLSSGGYIDDIRYTNTRNLSEYLKGNYRLEEDYINKSIKIENEFILGFRKLKGINKLDFKNKYGIDILDISVVKKLINENKLIDDGINIYINHDMIYTSNNILIEFLGGNYE